jgi:hypothetical protein
MPRSPVIAAWIAGLVLALVVLLAGATPLWIAVQEGLDWLTYTLVSLSEPVILVLRAAAIGLALTAVLLARSAAARGLPARGTLAGAALLWVLIVVVLQHAPSGLRWGLAALVALAATLSLSRRAA